MIRRLLVSGCASVIFAVAFLGCDKKIPECESIVKVISPSSEKLKKAAAAPTETPEQMTTQLLEIAKVSTETATDLAKLKLTVPELQKFSTDYQAMAKDMADASTEVANLQKKFESADAAETAVKLKSSFEKVDSVQKREGPLIDGLSKFCTGS